MDNKNAAEKILKKLFKNQLIADAQIQDNNERVYMKYRKQMNDEGQVKVRMVTTQSQVPFIVSFFAKSASGKDSDMGHDIVATKVAGGSQEYIKWVREQVGLKFSGSSSSPGGSKGQSLVDADSDANEELIGDLPPW